MVRRPAVSVVAPRPVLRAKMKNMIEAAATF